MFEKRRLGTDINQQVVFDLPSIQIDFDGLSGNSFRWFIRKIFSMVYPENLFDGLFSL